MLNDVEGSWGLGAVQGLSSCGLQAGDSSLHTEQQTRHFG